MPRLINRQRQVPGGIRWLEPATQFTIRPWSSFDSAVQQIILHRQGNPALKAKLGWSTDYAAVADELDAFNAAMCQQMGWLDYISISEITSPAIAVLVSEPQKATKCCGG